MRGGATNVQVSVTVNALAVNITGLALNINDFTLQKTIVH